MGECEHNNNHFCVSHGKQIVSRRQRKSQLTEDFRPIARTKKRSHPDISAVSPPGVRPAPRLIRKYEHTCMTQLSFYFIIIILLFYPVCRRRGEGGWHVRIACSRFERMLSVLGASHHRNRKITEGSETEPKQNRNGTETGPKANRKRIGAGTESQPEFETETIRNRTELKPNRNRNGNRNRTQNRPESKTESDTDIDNKTGA